MTYFNKIRREPVEREKLEKGDVILAITQLGNGIKSRMFMLMEDKDNYLFACGSNGKAEIIKWHGVLESENTEVFTVNREESAMVHSMLSLYMQNKGLRRTLEEHSRKPWYKRIFC